MRILLIVAIIATMLGSIGAIAQEPAKYDWTGSLEIWPRLRQHFAVQDMPTPAPIRTNVHLILQTWHDRPIESPDQDNEKIKGSVWGTNGENFLTITENEVRVGGDTAKNRIWNNVNLQRLPHIRIDHYDFTGTDTSTFFFTKGRIDVRAWLGQITPSGPEGE